MPEPDADATTQNCPACGTAVDVASAEPLARVECPQCAEKFRVEHAFDHFALIETLGVGGMGSVYKARDTRLDRLVALKILRRELSMQPGETARLEQEARVTAAVNHPNVVQLFSSGNDHGQFYLVMELVDHGSLDDLIEEHKKLPEAQVLEIGIQIALGLQAAQEKGLIHRDIKPANILFANEKTAKIGDFGLAIAAGHKSEAQDEIWGTPYYVAPERLNNEPEDFRSDIFSLGAMLFHALAGVPPIDGESTSASELRLLKSRPPDLRKVAPRTSRPTAKAINRMIVPDPRLRFRSYAEVITALQRAQQTLAAGQRAFWQSPIFFGTLLVLAALAGVGYFRLRPRAVTPATTAVTDTAPNLVRTSVQPAYEAARKEFLAGQLPPAAAAFKEIEPQAQGQQPVLNWIRMHRGLISLLSGDADEAHAAFHAIEQDGSFSAAAADPELAKFFTETAPLMATENPVPVTPIASGKGPGAFALLCFGLKDWQLGSFATAVTMLEQFAGHDFAEPYRWMNEYKPIAEKFLADYRPYAAWKEGAQTQDPPAAIAGIKAVREGQQTGGEFAKMLESEEAALAGKIAEKQQGEEKSRAEASRIVREKEAPGWNAALADYRTKVAAFDFGGALRAVTTPQLSDPELKAAQQAAMKKAGWLGEWKSQFLKDVRARPLQRALSDVAGIPYKGISAADADHLSLTLQYGSTLVSWQKLSKKTLLEASTAYLVTGDPHLADREWRCAVFAAESGQPESATKLGEAAAQLNAQYREQLPLLAPSAP